MNLVRLTFVLGTISATFAACSKPADRVEITETSTRSDLRPVPQVNASSEDRFARAIPKEMRRPSVEETTTGGAPETAMTPDASLAPSASGMFTFETPPGWQQIAATDFRDPNFVLGKNGEIQCYVSVLGGAGGGIQTNANRWRTQMGRAPYTDAEYAQLPRATVLGQEAVIVDFPGDFKGMNDEAATPGYRLVGALVPAPNAAIFIKMVGPDAAVESEKDNFALFAQSLKMGSAPSPDKTEAASAPVSAPEEPVATQAAAPTEAGGYAWTVPAGWSVDPAGSSMRLVTFRFGEGNAGECYVAVMPGAAGGRLENFNRWLAQMDEPPLVETELDLQPTTMLFGDEVPMLIAKGTYKGMGNESRAGSVMFGAISTLGGESVFVKLIAPETMSAEQFRNFQKFCGSLEKK